MIFKMLQTYIIYCCVNMKNTKMEDFEGNYKFKIILPLLALVSFCINIFGHIYFPQLTSIVTRFITVYITIKVLYSVISGFKTLSNISNILDQEQRYLKGEKRLTQGYKHLHAFIIPNYNESIQLLQETLAQLAKHNQAKTRYLVYLGMEKWQKESHLKAKKLLEKFTNSFKQMGYSIHDLRQFEQRGKASNVSWCVQNLQETYFKEGGIDPEDVYLTIIDADSWVPQGYIYQLDPIIAGKKDSQLQYVFHPWQIFTRNSLKVPILNRLYCQSTSMNLISLLSSPIDATFAISNYTLPFSFIKKIGFWDTCADAIGEDFHTNLKIFWKGEGKIRTFPIYIPFNQLCIQTGEGIVEDLKAQFWQMERHIRGCADFSYILNMFFKKKMEWRAIVVSLWAIQIYLIQTFAPWTITAYYVRNFFGINIFIHEEQQFFKMSIVSNILTVTGFMAYAIFLHCKNRASKILYNLQSSRYFMMELIQSFIMPVVLFFTFPAISIAHYKILTNNHEYQTAKKSTNAGKKLS